MSGGQANREIRPLGDEHKTAYRNQPRPMPPRFEPRQQQQPLPPQEKREERKDERRPPFPPPREEKRVAPAKKPKLGNAEKDKFNSILEDLVGTRGAYMLDDKLNILGKVPVTELLSTIKSIGTGVFAVLLDGNVERELVETAERSEIQFIVGTKAENKESARVLILTPEDLE